MKLSQSPFMDFSSPPLNSGLNVFPVYLGHQKDDG